MKYNFSQKFHIPKSSQGFTLIETLVAISILMIAVVGPLSAISSSLSQIKIVRDQMIAINLAQEGIEAVRQVRDSNMLGQWSSGSASPVAWKSGLNQPRYTLDLGGVFPILDSCNGACVIGTDIQTTVYQDLTSGGYRQVKGKQPPGPPTKFSRVIDVADQAGNNEIKVTATVQWMVSLGQVKTVVVNESLFGISSP